MKENNNNTEIKLLKSIHYYYNKEINKIKKEDNILIKYLKDSKIIKNNKENNLLNFINELSNQIKKGNNIILPFIDPCYNLIEAYINNNDILDKENKHESEMEKKWENIFRQLIENSFFNRKNLIPIYAYFTQLYSSVENLTQSDEKLDKLSKIINLWKLFYSYNNDKKRKINTSSSFCFIGSGLEIYGINDIPINYFFSIKINFLNDNFINYIKKDDYIFTTESDHFEYSIIKNYKNIKSINFKLKKQNLEIFIEYNTNTNEGIETGFYKNVKSNYSKLSLLNNFYGQIKSIEISINKDEHIVSKSEIKPYYLKYNDGTIFNSHYKINLENKNNNNIFIFENSSQKDAKSPEIIIKLKLTNLNLVKTNYINYKEENNIIDYFGGIVQFLPFLHLINRLYRNENIFYINNIKKENFLINFSKNILLVIVNYVVDLGTKKYDKIKMYWNFFLYIINKIEPFNSNEKIDIDEFFTNKINQNNNFYQFFYNFLFYISSKDKNKKELLNLSIKQKKIENKTNINLFGKTNIQLYRHLMKELFVYNRLWSKQNLFFKNVYDCYKNNNDNELKIKFKRINYYTSNYQQPFIYPILEINRYYPGFRKFQIENLYKNKNEKILNYDFSLDKYNNILNKDLFDNYIDNNNNEKYIKCCLIKKMYHIKGEIGFESVNERPSLVFSSCNKDYEEKCNKKDTKDKKKEYNHHLCYGSVFPCSEKDKKKFIIIPKYKIMFAIRRIYYYRLSGLEIFTSDNKSYYFNLSEELKENNNIIKENFSKDLKEIIQNKNILGWYNPYYSDILKPLFNDNIDEWNEKNYYYSNFDKLMIINLFSNRSFNDLNQYPVFPMLYDEIKLKRDMSKPIGLQELTEKGKERKKQILDTYYLMKNDYEEDEDDNNENYLFNLFFSNITYICNYLIRVFPYSFISIEIQGEGFDDPNRLFFSLKSTFENTLSQNSDLRELIPEFFYFPPLFYNENNLELHKLSNGKDIDDVNINDWNENKLKKYIFLQNMRDYLENEEKINLWIDLIFGINKEYNEERQRYYNKDNNIYFQSNQEILNDEINLQKYDFGVLPYQLFNENFPEKPKISKNLENEIYIFNKTQFVNEHLICLSDEKVSFICYGEKGINPEYLKIINNIKNENSLISFFKNFLANELNISNNFFYLFVGDVFGNVSVYKKVNNQSQIRNNNNKEIEDNIKTRYLDKIDKEYLLLKILTDHTNEIKYIDYNPRLNLMIDYALDGYINIYTMPTLKLIFAIQTKDYIKNEIIKNVVLISNPFPMICCISLNHIYVFDINGKIINTLNIEENSKIIFCIDKNCGLFNDFISYNKNNKEYKYPLLKNKI